MLWPGLGGADSGGVQHGGGYPISETRYPYPTTCGGSRTDRTGPEGKSSDFCRCCQVQWTAGNPWERVLGGAGGIRTLDTLLAYTHFPGERLRPHVHRSACHGRHVPYRARHLFASVTFISGAEQEILADGAFRYNIISTPAGPQLNAAGTPDDCWN